MQGRNRSAALLASASVLTIAVLALPAIAQKAELDVKPVTWEDIAQDHLSTNNVLMYGFGQNAQRYSTLTQINDTSADPGQHSLGSGDRRRTP